MALLEVMPQDCTGPSEWRAVNSSEEVNELSLPTLSGSIESSHTSLLHFEFVANISGGVTKI